VLLTPRAAVTLLRALAGLRLLLVSAARVAMASPFWCFQVLRAGTTPLLSTHRLSEEGNEYKK